MKGREGVRRGEVGCRGGRGRGRGRDLQSVWEEGVVGEKGWGVRGRGKMGVKGWKGREKEREERRKGRRKRRDGR